MQFCDLNCKMLFFTLKISQQICTSLYYVTQLVTVREKRKGMFAAQIYKKFDFIILCTQFWWEYWVYTPHSR